MRYLEEVLTTIIIYKSGWRDRSESHRSHTIGTEAWSTECIVKIWEYRRGRERGRGRGRGGEGAY